MVPDGRSDGRNGRTDGRTDGRRHNYIPLTSSGDNKDSVQKLRFLGLLDMSSLALKLIL